MARDPRKDPRIGDLAHGDPAWLGQPSSVSKVALERMDAFLSETREDGATPIAYYRVAGVVVVGNEDGAHHVIAETNGALNDIGYSTPGQNWTYWNKGPGPGEEEWLSTEERDWSISPVGHAPRTSSRWPALQASPIRPPAATGEAETPGLTRVATSSRSRAFCSDARQSLVVGLIALVSVRAPPGV